jgi:hypothetical protein
MAAQKLSSSSSGKKAKKSIISEVQETAPSQIPKTRKTRQKKTKEESQQQRVKKEERKLQLIKSAFERREIKTFDNIFVYIDPSPFGRLIGLQFYSFNDKVADPGKFTYNDIVRFSNVVQVDFDVIKDFIGNLVKDPTRKTTPEHRPLYFKR